ncbi:palmitoyltransferase ZDHHC11 isoform X1 [Latimeria chalumnae]
MNCYDRRLRRTGPAHGNNGNDLVAAPQRSRVNGWSLPLHTFQLVAWLLFSYLAVVGFGIYIPLLPYGWKNAGYAVIGLVFIYHSIVHLAAVSVDPADPSVRAKKNYNGLMPVFDRSKHTHVIQNLHCYLCEVDVGPKAKHCSSCNKCISDFDHHCKWLNNCVGGRNYRFFFHTVVSAAVGVLLLVLVILYVFIQHFINPADLRTAPQFDRVSANTTWLAFLPFAPIETSAAGLLAIAAITVLLGLACLLLLGHLLVFHIYLLRKKLSTYDYIVEQRHKQETKSEDMEMAQTTTPARTISFQALDPQKEGEAPVSSKTKHQEQGQVSLRQPNSICAETSDLSPVTTLPLNPQMSIKKSENGTGDTNSSNQIKRTSENTKGAFKDDWKHDRLSNFHGSVKSGNNQQSKVSDQGSVESLQEIPTVQNPLGSSTMDSSPTRTSIPTDSYLWGVNQNATLSSPWSAPSGNSRHSSKLSSVQFTSTSLSKQEIEMLPVGTNDYPAPQPIASRRGELGLVEGSPQPNDVLLLAVSSSIV